MKNFIFKSTDADLQKMFQSIETIQKNVLYVTYRTDMLLKKVNTLANDLKLQWDADSYYKQATLDETSHQTETGEQN